MSFQLNKGGFEFKRDKCELISVHKNSIVKIVAYTDDLFSYDEHVIEVELEDGLFYKFYESDDGFKLLLDWLTVSYALECQWIAEAFPLPFSDNVTTIWKERL